MNAATSSGPARSRWKKVLSEHRRKDDYGLRLDCSASSLGIFRHYDFHCKSRRNCLWKKFGASYRGKNSFNKLIRSGNIMEEGKKMNLSGRLGTILAASILFTGCAVAKRIDNELPKTFLEKSDLSAKIERLPFDHSWSDPTVNWKAYKSVFIKPIRTDLLPEGAWRESISLIITGSESYRNEVNELGVYFHDMLTEEIKKREGQHLANIAATPGPGVAVLEFAFTEVEFSHPLQKVAALAAPVPGTGLVSNAISDPFVTFALRITDGATSKLLATAADRKYSPRRIINLDKFTATSANREICQLWAEEFAETLGSDAMTKISEVTWSWLPW